MVYDEVTGRRTGLKHSGVLRKNSLERKMVDDEVTTGRMTDLDTEQC